MTRFTLLIAISLLLASPLPAQRVLKNGPFQPAGGVRIGKGFPVEEKESGNAPKGAIDLEAWNLSAPVVGDFVPIRVDLDPGEIILKPNADNPGNSFGWIESPSISIPAGAGKENQLFVVEVRYSHPTAFAGTPPTLRVRIHTEDFSFYGEAGVPPNRFTSDNGSGIVRAIFDRGNLHTETNVKVFIDLLSVEEGFVDPENFFRVLETRFEVIDGGTPEEGPFISAAYLEFDGDVFVHLDGSQSRTRVRADADSYAYDRKWIAVIQDGDVFAISAENLSDPRRIDDDGDVVDIAVAGPFMLLMNLNGRVDLYNFETNEREEIGTAADGVASAGDGKSLLALDFGSLNNAFKVFGFDPTATDPEFIELTGGFEVDDVRGRMNQHY